jgi:hypothetical protein
MSVNKMSTASVCENPDQIRRADLEADPARLSPLEEDLGDEVGEELESNRQRNVLQV